MNTFKRSDECIQGLKALQSLHECKRCGHEENVWGGEQEKRIFCYWFLTHSVCLSLIYPNADLLCQCQSGLWAMVTVNCCVQPPHSSLELSDHFAHGFFKPLPIRQIEWKCLNDASPRNIISREMEANAVVRQVWKPLLSHGAIWTTVRCMV